MAGFTSINELITAMMDSSQSFLINKNSISNTAAGQFHSLWYAQGTPGPGALPTVAAYTDLNTPGALHLVNPPAGQNLYMSRLYLVASTAGVDAQVHDRLGHMGGLSGTVLTAQTVNLSAANAAITDRYNNLTELLWWLEWYTDTGATARTFTVNVTHEDDTTGNINISVAATARATRLYPIYPTVDKAIKSVNSVTVTGGSTGTVGNFGVTITRPLINVPLGLAGSGELLDFSELHLTKIPTNACLQVIIIAGATTSGYIYGNLRAVAK